jgi:hypothetical protein
MYLSTPSQAAEQAHHQQVQQSCARLHYDDRTGPASLPHLLLLLMVQK